MTSTNEQIYIGNIQQLMQVKEYRFSGGRAEGVRGIDISNGAGLELTILPDRSMDLYSLRLNGKSLNYLSPAGISHPSYYSPQGNSWLKRFYGGFLTSCGLENIGSQSLYQGQTLGMHGGISNTPAEYLSVKIATDVSPYKVTVEGTMRDSYLFGSNFTFIRTISCAYKSPVININDKIKNIGFHTYPCMVLYHFNLGYPLLSENATLTLPTTKVVGRNKHAQQHESQWQSILPPQEAFEEICYYHNMQSKGGKSFFELSNPDSGLYLNVSYNTKHLTHFVQWKLFEKGSYVMGLEPCNASIDGIAKAEEDKSLKYLKPGEAIENTFTITVKNI